MDAGGETLFSLESYAWDGRQDSALDSGTDIGYGFSPSSRAVPFNPATYEPSVPWHSDDYLNPLHVAKNGSWHSVATPLPHLAIPPSVYARQKHGQITPPDERSPKSAASGQSEKEEKSDVEEDTMEVDEEVNTRQPTGRRRKTMESAQEDDATSPKRRKRNRASKPPENPEEEVKREKFLERNRVAASKCRQKKKEWTSNLEQQARELTAQRAHLQAYVASLRDEVLYLKDQMLRHSDCNCVKMREYLSQSVNNLSPTTPSVAQLAESMDGKPSVHSPSVASVAGSVAPSRRSSTTTVAPLRTNIPAVSPLISVNHLGMSTVLSPQAVSYRQ